MNSVTRSIKSANILLSVPPSVMLPKSVFHSGVYRSESYAVRDADGDINIGMRKSIKTIGNIAYAGSVYLLKKLNMMQRYSFYIKVGL